MTDIDTMIPTWEVVVRMGKEERVYSYTVVTRYAACRRAIEEFMEEFGLPGRPYEYWGGNVKNELLEISSRSSIDKRRFDLRNE